MISNQMYSVEDIIIASESSSEPFQDFHVITTKSKFLERVYDLVPRKLLAREDTPAIRNCVRSIIDAGTVEVSEFVDFESTPPVVCINADSITDDVVIDAARLVVKAIEQSPNGASGVVVLSGGIAYTTGDLSHLFEWH